MPLGQRVVLIGGGHNALVAAFYLARGGFKPLVLERREMVGGGGIYPTKGLPEKTCELVKMYLLPVARGKGVGKMIITANYMSDLHLCVVNDYHIVVDRHSTGTHDDGIAD